MFQQLTRAQSKGANGLVGEGRILVSMSEVKGLADVKGLEDELKSQGITETNAKTLITMYDGSTLLVKQPFKQLADIMGSMYKEDTVQVLTE